MQDYRAEIVCEWRGREDYDACWRYQLEQQALRRNAPENSFDRLILVEHPPTVTLGRHGCIGNLLGGENSLAGAGIEFRKIERGGDITYHGPGQLVGYPILHLRTRGLSLRQYLRGIEELLIEVLAQFGLQASAVSGLTGVWVEGRKLAAIGVAVSGGVSYHGFALNVAPDLEHFGYIVPCGLAGKEVGSLAQLLGPACPSLDEVRSVVEERFLACFGRPAATGQPAA